MHICFITDGGPKIGMGHVQQALTLAREFPSAASIEFLTKSDETIVDMIRESGFAAALCADDTELLRRVVDTDPDVVIFDKIDVDVALAEAIRSTVRAGLVIFTNLTDANAHAHIAVTADIGSQFANVHFIDPQTNTRFYYGPKYWVLRREFHEYRNRHKPPPPTIERILLIFGGSDPSNFTSVTLDELMRLDRPVHLDVILGAAFGHEDSVRAVIEAHPTTRATVNVRRDVKNVAELMYAADLVLASPGLSAFEALCVGTPIIVMPQDSLQRDTYRGFMRMLERHEMQGLRGMIERAEFTNPQDDGIRAMEIGRGVTELVEEILALGAETRA